MSAELDRIRERVWAAIEGAPPRDVAPLARILIDLERGAEPEQAATTLSQLEEKRRKRAAGG